MRQGFLTKTRDFIQQGKQLCTAALNELRRSVAMLRSDPLSGKELEEAIADCLQQFQHSTALDLNYDLQIHTPIPKDLNTTLYRIIAEALTNICKHSQAQTVDIQLTTDPSPTHSRAIALDATLLHLSIQDDHPTPQTVTEDVVMIRLLLVDDQTLIRQGLKSLLDAMSDLEVVGEADNGATALDQIVSLNPDVVLMGVRMPVMDGVVATQHIQQQSPDTKVLVLTTFDDENYIRPAMENGAIGYLLKDTPAAELVDAIRAAHKGYTQMGPGLFQKTLSSSPPLSSTPSIAIPPTTPFTPSFSNTQISALKTLTDREQEVLTLIAQGANNREIADVLYISEKTVKNHVTNILSRLGVRDRTQAAILAHSHPGLLPPKH